MHEVKSIKVPGKSERLMFIDMARSIAIILMLQGHFITLVFKDYRILHSTLVKTGTSGYLLFDWWVKIRGFTAPLFFTITGMVFVYLLIKHEKLNDPEKFTKNKRIKKGFKRAFVILFWAYLLQINLKYFKYYLHGHLNEQIFAFHILQSIAFGLMALMLVYGLFKLIKKGTLPIYYCVFGAIVFLCYPLIKSLPEGHYFPANAPLLIQNMFYGPKSEFPMIPWMGFVLFGGMLGALLHDFEYLAKNKWFPFITVLFGIALMYSGRLIGFIIDYFLNQGSAVNIFQFEKNAWMYDRLAEVILLLSILIVIERKIKIKDSLALKMGQNTLPIYIVHVILLYGAIIGYSLKDLLKHQLPAGQAVLSAILFLILFAYFIKYIEYFEDKIKRFKNMIFTKSK